MNNTRWISQLVGLSLVVVVYLTACATTSQPTPSPMPPTLTPAPTSTPVPPTLTPAPSATPTQSLNPAPRGYTSMTYDSESKRVILFGGQTGNYALASSYDGATWAYDAAANKWTFMEPPTGPSEMAAAELAYDTESDRVILFGGIRPVMTIKADTWAYDYNTNTWKKMAIGPSNHIGPRLAYDTQSDRVILFGGYSPGGFYYNDTWAYDFNTDTWTNMKPLTGPPGRNYHAMTYDTQADRVLVWGGMGTPGITPVEESIWSYDFNTNTWLEVKPGEGAHPAGRDYPSMVYNAKAERTILYGGDSGDDETWAYAYKTNTWTKLTPSTSPGPLSRHSMIYNSTTDRVILFGGQMDSAQYKYTDETWAYDFNTNTWTNVTPKQ